VVLDDATRITYFKAPLGMVPGPGEMRSPWKDGLKKLAAAPAVIKVAVVAAWAVVGYQQTPATLPPGQPPESSSTTWVCGYIPQWSIYWSRSPYERDALKVLLCREQGQS